MARKQTSSATKRVRALKVGFFDGRMLFVGDEFEVPADAHGKWFVEVGSVQEVDAELEALLNADDEK